MASRNLLPPWQRLTLTTGPTHTGLINDGVTGGAKTTISFAAYAGASVTLAAYGGAWHVLGLKAATVS